MLIDERWRTSLEARRRPRFPTSKAPSPAMRPRCLQRQRCAVSPVVHNVVVAQAYPCSRSPAEIPRDPQHIHRPPQLGSATYATRPRRAHACFRLTYMREGAPSGGPAHKVPISSELEAAMMGGNPGFMVIPLVCTSGFRRHGCLTCKAFRP